MNNSLSTIVLVGLMGAGKSRVGRELARLLNLPFVDADSEIEAAAGATVAEIFRLYGEKTFRDGEKRVMQRLLSGPPVVLAAGGGAFIQPEIRALVKKSAISVWLQADLDTLVARTARRPERRPLLQGVDPAAKLAEMMSARYPVYAEADIALPADSGDPAAIARNIETLLRARGGGPVA